VGLLTYFQTAASRSPKILKAADTWLIIVSVDASDGDSTASKGRVGRLLREVSWLAASREGKCIARVIYSTLPNTC